MDSCIPNWYESAFWWGLVVAALYTLWSYGRITELRWDVEYYKGEAARGITKGSAVVEKTVRSQKSSSLGIPGAVDDDHLEPIGDEVAVYAARRLDEGEDDDGNVS